jgi:hypothetical protein
MRNYVKVVAKDTADEFHFFDDSDRDQTRVALQLANERVIPYKARTCVWKRPNSEWVAIREMGENPDPTKN